MRQNRVQPRLKILFSFGPQLAALDRESSLDGLDPAEQQLDVLPRLCVIFLQVAGNGHPLPKGVFQRMVGGLERIRCGAGSEQARMSSKKVFEAEIGGEVSLG